MRTNGYGGEDGPILLAAKRMKKNNIQNKELTVLAAFFSVLLCTLFGANTVAIKISLSGLGVFTTAGLRFSIAAVVIFLWARITRRSFYIRKDQWPQLLTVGLLFTVQLSLMYLGLSKTNASRGTLLINIQPFFILLLAHFFIPGDAITLKKVAGISIGFAGVVFVFLEKTGVTADFRSGDLLILAGTLVWACNTVYIKRIIDAFSPFHIVLYPMVLSVPCFFIEALLWDHPMIGRLEARVIGALFYQGFVTASFGFVAWNTLLQKYGATALHSFVFIMPVAGVGLGGLILGEPITAKIVAALGLVISGIVVVQFKLKKYEPATSLERGL